MSKKGIALIAAAVLLLAVSAGIYFFADSIDLDPSGAAAPADPYSENTGTGDGGGNNYASWGFIAGGFGY